MFHNHTLLDAVRVPRVVTTFPCPGTAGFHSPSPNDITTSDWAKSAGSSYGYGAITDPLSGTTASNFITIGTGGGAFSISVQSIAPFTLNSATVYTFGFYVKPIAGPTWILTQASDGVVAVGSWFNLSGSGVVGNSNLAGAGNLLNCAQIIPSTNGYYRVSFGISLTTTNAGMKLQIFMVDGNGTGAVTLNQEIYLWQICP